MNFKKHSSLLEGKHAFLSPSSYHWINYTPEKLKDTYFRSLQKQRGTELHALACKCIEMGVKLPRSNSTLNLYVNDAIGYKMTPEQMLYYSDNCFGTADAISFRKDILRIHDLKTGDTRASMKQLEIYAAIFCLEYGVNPKDIALIELRIYQNNEVSVYNPSADDISNIMDTIVLFDKELTKIQLEE